MKIEELNYLDEPELIFLIQIALGLRINQNGKIIIGFDYIKTLFGKIVRYDLQTKIAKADNPLEDKQWYPTEIYKKTINSLLYMEDSLGFKFKFFYDKPMFVTLRKSVGNSNKVSPQLQKVIDELNSYISFNSIHELVKQEGYISKMIFANLDTASLLPPADNEMATNRKRLTNTFKELKKENELKLEISSIDKEKITSFLKHYIEMFQKQNLIGLERVIHDIENHKNLLLQCIYGNYGKGKQTNNLIVELTKSEIAYYVAKIEIEKLQHIEEYRLIEFFLLLHFGKDLRLEDIEQIIPKCLSLLGQNEKKNELKIAELDWHIKFKLLKKIEEIVPEVKDGYMTFLPDHGRFDFDNGYIDLDNNVFLYRNFKLEKLKRTGPVKFFILLACKNENEIKINEFNLLIFDGKGYSNVDVKDKLPMLKQRFLNYLKKCNCPEKYVTEISNMIFSIEGSGYQLISLNN